MDDAYVHAGLDLTHYDVTIILENPSTCFFVMIHHFGHDM